MIDAKPIGVVNRNETERGSPADLREGKSTILVDPEYEDGLYRIEENDHLVVVFHLDRSTDYTLRGDRLYGSERGVFNSRSPNRPGKVGVTTVELLERDGRRLHVQGLDAIDKTPVLDIKPYVPGLDSPPTVTREDLEADPRAGVDANVRRRDLEALFVDAATLHGRHCPLLAAGVLAVTYAARDLGGRTTRGLIAGVEMEGCLVDAVQYVLGATAGNGRVRWRASGIPAITVAALDGETMRIELALDEMRSHVNLDELSCLADETDIDEMRLAALGLLDNPLSAMATIEDDIVAPSWLPDRP